MKNRSRAPDPVHAALVADWSEESRAVFPPDLFTHLEETGSTSDDLLARVREGRARHRETVAADWQSRGRGRRGDRWEAPPGRNLLFSVCLSLPADPAAWSRLPLAAARAVGAAVESVLGPGRRIEVKWPNDLLHQGRKLGGLLVETVPSPGPFAVLGAGLNVNTRPGELPAAIAPAPVSLYEILGCESNRWYILGLVLESLIGAGADPFAAFESDLAWAAARDALRGRRLRAHTEKGLVEGTGAGFGPEGQLLVAGPGGGITPLRSARRIELC